FGGRSPGGEISVSHGAQRLPQLLLPGVVTPVAERPRLVRGLPLVGNPIAAAPEEFAHLLGPVEAELRPGGPVCGPEVVNHDRHPVRRRTSKAASSASSEPT